MDFLPVYLDVKNRKCLIVGGGVVALRKAKLLIRSGAVVYVVSLEICSELQMVLDSGKHKFRVGELVPSDLENSALVVAATDNETLNRRVSDLATDLCIPVNVVDQPQLCTMIFPAIVDRSPVIVSISSSGKSPVLVRHIKAQLEIALPNNTGRLADLLGSFRHQVKTKIGKAGNRIRFWETILDSQVPELVYGGNIEQAKNQIEQQIISSENATYKGEVYLVGAGPGDPDLLTLRALRLMQKADIVLYDRLVSDEIMQKIRPDAEVVHVGKERSKQAIPQETINDLLVRLAREGKRVLRLKGGDPFIFGRGGEEMMQLMANNIPFQIVPGITAASGCASYAGIPLTHRDYAHSVQFLTGHFTQENEQPDWDWLVQGSAQQTLVFYMGLLNLQIICEQLINHGLEPHMPVALIQKGTRKEQRVIVGTLDSLPSRVVVAEIQAPTLLIIGKVVGLRERFDWFNPDTNTRN